MKPTGIFVLRKNNAPLLSPHEIIARHISDQLSTPGNRLEWMMISTDSGHFTAATFDVKLARMKNMSTIANTDLRESTPM